ncbi:MAG: hypothetical protein HY321_06295 [Armatimonadetes bacterium]|nr:hypothetical protein [Armatimonadota bacterium]
MNARDAALAGCAGACLALCLAILPAAAPAGESIAGFRAAGPTVPFPAVSGVDAPRPVPSGLTAAGYRKLAESHEAAGRYQEASVAYRKEATIRRKLGDVNGAKVEESKADWWHSEVILYREAPLRGARCGPAKFEPASGCYIGAIVERDPRVGGDHATFNRLTGKDHSLFFDYRSYGVAFPVEWARRLKAVGAAAQIAYEPTQGLEGVRDDATLQEFARAAAASGIPVFLRFAGEMNGDWVRYNRDPAEYIRKWRLVHGVMRRLAPNVAMVWTPNAIPEHNITRYYPGDDTVDWVGVNFYTVHHHNNLLSRPAEREDPADMLRFIYDRYAARKPIMVCEYAATHFCKADGKTLPRYAADKLRTLYTALPRRYPRVKAICWYDIDNTTHSVRAGRDINNYSLTDNEEVLAAYRDTVAGPYFLSTVETGGTRESGVRFEALAPGRTLSGSVRLSAWAKTHDDRPVVGYRLDGKPVLATAARPYEVEWDTRRAGNGEHTLEALVFVKGRVAARQSVSVRVVN